MSKVVLYEPSIGSDNLGDEIIVDAVKKALNRIISNEFAIELPTHTSVNWRYLRFLDRHEATYKIVCGSNIIVGNLYSYIHLRQWAIPLLSLPWYGPVILIGVGSQQYNQRIRWCTKFAYKYLLRKDIVHSVRDSYTEKALKSIGITNIINTACPTMWELTEDHCRHIPVEKGKYCICTLTDYKKNIFRDNAFLNTLKRNYEKVYFWAQGNGDEKYFHSLTESKDVEEIPPTLDAYNRYLEEKDTDYVGTRLHGGIRALQKMRRTIIIGIDNRATELHNDFGIPVLDQNDMDRLEELLQSQIMTKIKLPTDNIARFLGQFS